MQALSSLASLDRERQVLTTSVFSFFLFNQMTASVKHSRVLLLSSCSAHAPVPADAAAKTRQLLIVLDQQEPRSFESLLAKV